MWQAIDRLIAQGKITYVGSSNFPGWKIAQASEKAIARHGLGLVSEQSVYNLIERRAELEVIPAAREYGLGVITWSPLAGGVLAGVPSDGGGRRQAADIQSALAARADQLACFARLCADLGEAPSCVALAWALHQPGIVATIVGQRNLEQLRSVAGVPEIALCKDVLAGIDAIFPPCGPAPEAYAW